MPTYLQVAKALLRNGIAHVHGGHCSCTPALSASRISTLEATLGPLAADGRVSRGAFFST